MSIVDRNSLEQSSLADLHAIASELSIDSYRRLRKAELIDAILERQGGGAEPADGQAGDQSGGADEATDAVDDETQTRDEGAGRRRRGRRGGRGRARDEAEPDEADGEPLASEDRQDRDEHPPELVEGVVEVLPGGSGFVRVNPPDPSDDDVYISAAQVRRCELVSGDRVAGPRRPPRRSERFASLVRVDSVNGRPAAEIAEAVRVEDLPAAFPSSPLLSGSGEHSIKAMVAAAPIGRGSRVTIAGPAQSGKSELLKVIAAELAGEDELQVWLVLSGARPEEIPEWESGKLAPSAAVSLGASSDVQSQAVDAVVEQARRVAARGSHAVVLIDSVESVHDHAVRKALGSARAVVEGGSLTVIVTASEPIGGETTVVALDPRLAAHGKFPALDIAHTWTMRAEQLVGHKEAEKIGRARAKAAGG
jgi:transcription termination factor Rho